MSIRRRQLIQAGAAAALAAPVLGVRAQARTKVKVGYLHTPAVDSHIFIGQQMGSFAKQGLDLDLIPFTTGLELFQAMIGGSLDMLSTGAVLSNFPARGQGKVFLMNNIEFATAQLWVREDSGIKTIADLKTRNDELERLGSFQPSFRFRVPSDSGRKPSKRQWAGCLTSRHPDRRMGCRYFGWRKGNGFNDWWQRKRHLLH